MSNLLCIGHRGAMGHEPENTLRSFKKALELGCPWVELDVQIIENELIVFHDDRLDRVTNGKGLIKNQKLSYIRSLDAGKGERIPTLSEVFDLIDKRASINVELKMINTAAPVVSLIDQYVKTRGWRFDQFLISSFDHVELKKAHALNLKIPIGVLVYGIPVDLARGADEMKASTINISNEFISQELIDDAHNRGLKVFVYTINEPEDIEEMKRLGVDGVFTNYPERVLVNRINPL